MSARFTAKQYAEAFGCSERQARRFMEAPAALCLVSSSGRWNNTLALTNLPPERQKEITGIASRRGYPSAEAYMQSIAGRDQWEPDIPLNKWPENDLVKAAKRRRALRRALELRDKPGTVKRDWIAMGVEDYTREFQTSVSRRWIADLVDIAVDRDRNARKWDRLELYLPNCPSAVSTQKAGGEEPFPELVSYLDGQSFATSRAGRRGIWQRIFDEYDRLAAAGESASSASRRLREFLLELPLFDHLNRNADNLLKNWNRAFACRETDGVVRRLDGRESNTGNHDGYAFTQDEQMLLLNRHWYCGGRVAQAWRELLLEKAFSPATLERYVGKSTDKSHVPDLVLESIKGEADLLYTLATRKKDFDLLKPYLTRTYAGIHSIDCVMADDVTLPVYFVRPDGSLTRGQCLVFIDFRTLRILGWALLPQKNYNAIAIYSELVSLFKQFGLPKVLYFERGIWLLAKLISGTNPNTLSIDEVSQGVREKGIRLIHAIRARTKTVERVLGLLQNRMEGEPGYCGRDERRDRPDITTKALAVIKSGATPSDHLYTFDQWNARLGDIMRAYNDEAQQGRILEGLSPEAGLEKYRNFEDPPMALPPELRYRLGAKVECTVKNRCIRFEVGRKKVAYFGPELAPFEGQRVLRWFDPENDELLPVTDQNGNNAVNVPLHKEVNALAVLTGDTATLSEELARSEATMASLKTKFNVIQSRFPMPQRGLLASARVLEEGAQLEAQRNDYRERERKQRNTRNHELANARAVERNTGVNIGHAVDVESARAIEKALKEASEGNN